MEGNIGRDLMKRISLKTRIKVTNQTGFINLLSELGYREGYWTEDEDDILDKLIELADEHTQNILDDITDWERDGKPE